MATNQLVQSYIRKILKALAHLEYSYGKVSKLPNQIEKLDEEELETWESFTSRFSRVVDLYLTKFCKAKVLENDAGFEGTLRDFINQAEKMGLVESADRWMDYRGIRNSAAHEYEEADLGAFFDGARRATTEVLSIKKFL
jgi:hypothetical protein